MSRKSLSDAQIRACLASINCEESEGEYFSGVESEDEYIPENKISSESSDEGEELENQAVIPSNPITPRSKFHILFICKLFQLYVYCILLLLKSPSLCWFYIEDSFLFDRN